MYCNSCGEQISDGSKFCPKCGKANPGIIQPQQYQDTINPVAVKTLNEKNSFLMVLGFILTALLGIAAIYAFIKLKTSFTGWAIAFAILIITGLLQKFLASKGFKTVMIIFAVSLVSVSASFIFTTNLQNGALKSLFGNGKSVSEDSGNTSGNISSDSLNNTKIDYSRSSVVSLGANRDDLGNIINGQYFFDDGKNQYYSSFDENNAAHIYKSTGGNTATPIFNGFGWSLIVYGDWLYFSGNEGTAIDGSYNLFRIKTDGSEVQRINTGFCYNMSFYDKWLYYIKKSGINSTTYSFCRSEPDGSNEEVIIADGGNCGIIYEGKIYFMDTSAVICSADPDGKNKISLINEPVKYFIIGNGSLIYIDGNSNIITADIDGKNIKTVKQAGEHPTHTINSYKDTIFYTYYDPNAVSGTSAYKYYLNSIRFNGSNDKMIYEGISFGFYINILGNKVYVLDYAMSPQSGAMVAIARNMDLDGSNVTDLYR